MNLVKQMKWDRRSTRTTRVTLQLFTTNENTCVMEAVKEGFPCEKPPTDVICFSCSKGVALLFDDPARDSVHI